MGGEGIQERILLGAVADAPEWGGRQRREYQRWEPLLCWLECLAATQQLLGFRLSPDHAKFHIGFPYLKKKSKGSFLTLFLGLLRS